MDMRTIARAVAFTALLVSCRVTSPGAQGTGAGMSIDLSASSAAMGAASNAVFWGEAPNWWGNPALLGYQQGIAYEWQSSQLVPGLATDVRLESEALRLGGAGIGLVFSGAPGSIGGRRLDYGFGGGEPGMFSSYEEVDSWGFGVSAARLWDGIRGAHGDRSTWSRFGDLSLGMNFKHVVIDLAPEFFFARAKEVTRDIGLHTRFTPTEWLARDGDLPVRVDLAYGWSRLNAGETRFVFINEGQGSPATQHERHGVALRVAFDPPSWTAFRERGRGSFRLIADALTPLLSLAVAYDHQRLSAGGEDPHYVTDGQGFEATLANVLTFRSGGFRDELGDRVADTDGWGVRLPLGRIGGLRYDRGTFPQSSGLPDVTRHSTVAWLDPVALWRAVRTRS